MKRLSTVQRMSCALLFVPWLICMATPCAVIALVSQGEIKITHSDLPDDAFRIWILDSTVARGFGISNARRVQPSSGMACLITDVSFLVWQGSAEQAGAKPVHSCACYQSEAGSWSLVSTGAEACAAAGETPPLTTPGTPAP